jgi:hypothetical protein
MRGVVWCGGVGWGAADEDCFTCLAFAFMLAPAPVLYGRMLMFCFGICTKGVLLDTVEPLLLWRDCVRELVASSACHFYGH